MTDYTKPLDAESGRCCCSCKEPAHKESDYCETCHRCGKHRPPRGRVNIVPENWAPPRVRDISAADYTKPLDAESEALLERLFGTLEWELGGKRIDRPKARRFVSEYRARVAAEALRDAARDVDDADHTWNTAGEWLDDRAAALLDTLAYWAREDEVGTPEGRMGQARRLLSEYLAKRDARVAAEALKVIAQEEEDEARRLHPAGRVSAFYMARAKWLRNRAAQLENPDA